ncbi:NAD(P)-dependent alcohol dehydrogenase [Sorangium sp. So ce726]|uniref:NAD(P)-dependent alcohol dehydrogenase n=1 Tax=Sorangium sp. So ce726 TaxID=3133319 RepID=UPI003F5E8D44
MRAIVQERYGPPEVLQLREVPRPAPKDNEVLIRVHATVATFAECAMRKGDPFIARLFTGLIRPRLPTSGFYLAGEIAAVGKGVTRWNVGDQVFGATGMDAGAYAEYKCLPEDATLARKPRGVTHAEAVSMCDGFLTGLPFLRDEGKVRAGQRVLINGASGGIGAVSVQLARTFGAEVTGVCSTANLDLVKSLGAEHVIDYTREDFTSAGRAYDVIFDVAGKSSFSRCKGALTPSGVYLTTVPTLTIVAQMLWTARTRGKKAIFAATGMRPAKEVARDLVILNELIESGRVRAVIDRRYPLERMAEAHARVEQAHKKGSVVVTTSAGDDEGAARAAVLHA